MARSKQFVSLSDVTDFVERTTRHGVPTRIAIDRAVKRFGVPRDLVKAFLAPSQGRK